MRIENINPIMEALTYYKYRACGKSISEGLKKYSDDIDSSGNELCRMLQPIELMEAVLNDRLDVEQAAVRKYFRPIDESLGIRGFSFADIIYMVPSHGRFEGIEAARAEVTAYSMEEKREIIIGSLTRNNRLHEENCADCNDFLKIIERQHMSGDEKWRLIQLYNNFDRMAAEIAELLGAAVDLISENSCLYGDLIAEFNSRYGDIEGSLGCYLAKEYDIDIPTYESEILLPWIFGYGDVQSAYSNAQAAESCTYIGVLVDFIVRKSKLKLMPGDCDGMLKALSDSNRINILKFLRDKTAYGLELAEYLNLSPNTISHHISKLQLNGFITSESEGSRVYYRSNKANIERFLALLSEMFIGK